MPTVLVADDTASIRLLLRTNLELGGYDVIEAVDGVDCVEQLLDLAGADTLPDAVTLDVMMPRQDGIETARAIRADERLAALTLVMVSTQNTPSDVQRGYDAGVDVYITKPFDPDTVVSTLDELLHPT